MTSNGGGQEGRAGAKTVAAIDVGSNSLRLVIAEVLADGRIEVLERLQRAVRLGRDTFVRGRLSGQSMRAALGVLRDYGKMLRLYQAISALFSTPESFDPHGNGTAISWSKTAPLNQFASRPASRLSNRNSQWPFRLIHCSL